MKKPAKKPRRKRETDPLAKALAEVPKQRQRAFDKAKLPRNPTYDELYEAYVRVEAKYLEMKSNWLELREKQVGIKEKARDEHETNVRIVNRLSEDNKLRMREYNRVVNELHYLKVEHENLTKVNEDLMAELLKAGKVPLPAK